MAIIGHVRHVVIGTAFMMCAILTGAVATAQTSFATIDGEIGPGALYRILVPTAVPWNGELVVFLQGIDDPANAIALSGPGMQVRDALIGQGFALIFTSRSVNGYGAVKDGMIRTHQLRGIFAAVVGEPTRVYLLGRSLGGSIAVMLAEMFPTQYDGIISGCGLLGGGVKELKYVGDARVLFDYFFPGIIPRRLFDSPDGDLTPIILKALQDGLGGPTLEFARTAKLEAATNSETVSAGVTVVGFGLRQLHDLLGVTHGHIPYDNSETMYEGSSNDTALNDSVIRFVGDPSAVEYLDHYYTPTGDLRIPVITLHKTRDPLVPRLIHEPDYAVAVANAGASQYLLQRTVSGFGHCGFPSDELAAFAALVQWVHTGVRPQY